MFIFYLFMLFLTKLIHTITIFLTFNPLNTIILKPKHPSAVKKNTIDRQGLAAHPLFTQRKIQRVHQTIIQNPPVHFRDQGCLAPLAASRLAVGRMWKVTKVNATDRNPAISAPRVVLTVELPACLNPPQGGLLFYVMVVFVPDTLCRFELVRIFDVFLISDWKECICENHKSLHANAKR